MNSLKAFSIVLGTKVDFKPNFTYEQNYFEYETCNHNVELSFKGTFAEKQKLTNNLDNEQFCLLVGDVSNKEELIANHDNYNLEDCILSLYNSYYLDMLRLVKGRFCLMIYDRGKVLISCGKSQGFSLYYKYDDYNNILYVSTELKAFPKDIMNLKSFESINQKYLYSNSRLTHFKDINRLLTGEVVSIDLKEKSLYCYTINSPAGVDVSIFDEFEASKQIKNKLTKSISQISDKNVMSLVSGGLDSSVVTYLANKQFDSLTLFSLGTERFNEFKEAETFASSINKNLNTIVVNEEDYFKSFLKVTTLMEHTYTEYLEYITPINIANQKLSSFGDNIISGYGSDILFAGFAKKSMDIKNIVKLIWKEYKSTFWANEMSQNLDYYSNTKTYYPYFDSEFLKESFKISPKLKFKNNIEKYILRKAFDNEIIQEVLWRKKVGIHEGSGCEDYFTKLFSIKSTSPNEIREQKNFITYNFFKFIFFENIKSEDIDYKEFKKITNLI